MRSTSPENLLTLSQAANRLPTRPSSCTIWRWCRKGVRARNGKRVRLEHMRLGGRILIAPEAIEQFGTALAAADGEHFQMAQPEVAVPLMKPRTESQQELAAREAMDRLRAQGIDC